jgi:hypothetical protein
MIYLALVQEVRIISCRAPFVVHVMRVELVS